MAVAASGVWLPVNFTVSAQMNVVVEPKRLHTLTQPHTPLNVLLRGPAECT